jgi:hypothetical protein
VKHVSSRRCFPTIQKDNDMENLWCVQDSAIEVEDYADAAEYKRFLERFCDDEEQGHRSRLLLGEEAAEQFPNRTQQRFAHDTPEGK